MVPVVHSDSKPSTKCSVKNLNTKRTCNNVFVLFERMLISFATAHSILHIFAISR
jgi:hypothetical protein